MEQLVTRHKLPNGIEIVVEEMPQLQSVSLGFWIKNGSRHESLQEAGLSHFIEHLLFKGTKNLSCKEIAEKTDMLGGNIDAFTSREKTSYIAKVVNHQFDEVFDLLADIILNPAFAESDIEMEKEVVLEEIRMVNDTPDDLVHEEFLQSLLGDHPMGRSILGTPESVNSYDVDQIKKFYRQRYTSNRILITVAGNVTPDQVIKAAQRSFAHLPGNQEELTPEVPTYHNKIKLIQRKDLEQVQLLMGIGTFAATDERRHAMEILNTYLGGSSSSRLFQNIRENKGLAYAISSYTSSYKDSGLMAFYAATSPDRVIQLITEIRKELNEVAAGKVDPQDVHRVKSMIETDVVLGMESSSNRMGMLARQILYFGEIKKLDDLLARFREVELPEVRELASQLLAGNMYTATALGNINSQADRIRKSLT